MQIRIGGFRNDFFVKRATERVMREGVLNSNRIQPYKTSNIQLSNQFYNSTFSAMLITIIMPALNEEKNVGAAIDDTIAAFKEYGIDGEILAVNDGSTDSTPERIKRKTAEYPGKVRMLTHPGPQGIGSSFWDGVDVAQGELVSLLPGDNENIPGEILRYARLLEDVDLVIPFVLNGEVRRRFRRFLSANYVRFINLAFGTSLNYTTGTVIYRKSLLKELTSRRMGFFFQTDILVRLVRRGYLFAEVPYRLRERGGGRSKAVRLRSLGDIIRGCFKLMIDVYFTKGDMLRPYARDSVTAERKKG